jgi:hypothetical protein
MSSQSQRSSAGIDRTYSDIRRPPSPSRLLLLLCGHALGKQRIDAISLAPSVIVADLFQGGRVVACSQFGLEAVGEMALGGNVGEEMGEVREPGLLGTQGALERDGNRVAPHDNQVHGRNCGHDLVLCCESSQCRVGVVRQRSRNWPGPIGGWVVTYRSGVGWEDQPRENWN